MENGFRAAPGAGRSHREWELRAMQLQALQPAVAAVLVVGYAALGYAGFSSDTEDVGRFAVGYGLLTAVGAAFWLRNRHPRLAARALAVGLAASLSLALHVHPSLGVAALFGPAVVVAGVLLGWRSGAFLATVATAAIVPALSGTAEQDSFETALVLLAVWSGPALSWLLTRPASEALAWAWQNYDDALVKTQELRERQAELGRLSKSLSETCVRLEWLNQELDEARRAAEDARRLKAQFAASISHELRTPLNLIIGFSEMMVIAPRAYGGEKLPDRYRGDVEAVYRNACHLSDLVDDILELSQIDANRLGLERQWTCLSEVVDEAVAAVASMFRDKQLTVVTHAPADLPRLYVDRTRVRQVLINLLNNAARFTDEGGVRISAELQERDVVVSVADTGVGIPPEDLPRVFEEFHQARHDGRSHHGGSGLGLAIVRRFVEMHGGNVWAESRQGFGTTFRFSLPLGENVVTQASPVGWTRRVRPSDGAATPSVLLLSLGDDPEPKRLLQRHLDGYRIDPVGSVREAHRLAGAPIAAIVTAGSEGAVEGQRDAGDFAGLPVVRCVWRTTGDLRARLGVDEYLVKPVGREQLKAAVRRLGKQTRELLIVDDDPEMLRLLGQMIASFSPRYRVRLASSGAAALAMLHASPPDAVVLDLLMPDVDGFAVLDEMRRDERRGAAMSRRSSRASSRWRRPVGCPSPRRSGA
jgi:signal transduction histidine kinase/CheY-like chemotaxis protein